METHRVGTFGARRQAGPRGARPRSAGWLVDCAHQPFLERVNRLARTRGAPVSLNATRVQGCRQDQDMASLCHPCQQGASLLPRRGGPQASLAQLTRGDGCAMEVLGSLAQKARAWLLQRNVLAGSAGDLRGAGTILGPLRDLVSIPSVCEPLVQVLRPGSPWKLLEVSGPGFLF